MTVYPIDNELGNMRQECRLLKDHNLQLKNLNEQFDKLELTDNYWNIKSHNAEALNYSSSEDDIQIDKLQFYSQPDGKLNEKNLIKERKRFKCFECHQSFINKHILQKHQKIIHKAIKCEYCPFKGNTDFRELTVYRVYYVIGSF